MHKIALKLKFYLAKSKKITKKLKKVLHNNSLYDIICV